MEDLHIQAGTVKLSEENTDIDINLHNLEPDNGFLEAKTMSNDNNKMNEFDSIKTINICVSKTP